MEYGTAAQDLKQLLPELISLQKSSGNLEDIFSSLENPGIDLKIFRGVHELLTFVVSRSLGKMMNQVPRDQGWPHNKWRYYEMILGHSEH